LIWLNNVVIPYYESGLRLELPAGQHFRFADLAPYKALSGQNLKEMDFAWVHAGQLFLLEVRSYSQVTTTLTGADFVPVKGQPAPHRFQALIDKITDSTLMLLAAWAGSAWGQQIKAELPVSAQSVMPLKLVIAVELPSALTMHLPGLRDSLNARLQGRVGVVDVPRVVLMDYARLISDPAFNGMVTAHP
jgi:hypothetical protein